jgi:hypothetical protein
MPPKDRIQYPKWLSEFDRRASLIGVIKKSFDSKCDCDVCIALREMAKNWEDMFPMPEPTSRSGTQ